MDRLLDTLANNEVKVVIGQGPAARVHIMELTSPSFIGTCTAKHEYLASLLKQFRCVIPVDPYSPEELLRLVELEAGKNHITFAPGAAELIVRCSNGQSGTVLARLRKVAGLIDQKSNTPYFNIQEVSIALAKLRIEIPSEQPASKLNLDSLTGQEFERLMKALLIEMGFQADLTEVTGDGGIDLEQRLIVWRVSCAS